MGRVTRAVEHLGIDELVVRTDSTKNAWHVRKLLVIWNATVDPRRAGFQKTLRGKACSLS